MKSSSSSETAPLLANSSKIHQRKLATFGESFDEEAIEEDDAKDVEPEFGFRHSCTLKKHSEALILHLSKRGADAASMTQPEDSDNDVMLYRNKVLVTWQAFRVGPHSVWRSWELWSMMAKLGCLSLFSAMITVAIVQDPAALQVAKFTEVSKFLNVIIGLMMGFFLSSSTKRWHNSVNAFLQLLDSIRNLQMQFKALGVPKTRSMIISRYGMASAWLLYAGLLTQWQRFNVTRGDLLKEAWDLFHGHDVNLDGSGHTRLLEDWEIEMLRTKRDPPGMLWLWIANLIGKLSQDGIVPAMQTPTYGRLMDLCQSGHSGIRHVKAAICVQAPLPYTHTLAILVHINNIINAITLGFVMGCCLGTILAQAEMHVYVAKATGKETSQDMQMVGVTFLYCFFGPLMYQGLLLIGFHLAQPFDHEDTSVPLELFLHRTEVDLRNGNVMCDSLPGLIRGFEMPCFKPPP